jgi:hypothetical protein
MDATMMNVFEGDRALVFLRLTGLTIGAFSLALAIYGAIRLVTG